MAGWIYTCRVHRGINTETMHMEGLNCGHVKKKISGLQEGIIAFIYT
jgi:hypothetical protein